MYNTYHDQNQQTLLNRMVNARPCQNVAELRYGGLCHGGGTWGRSARSCALCDGRRRLHEWRFRSAQVSHTIGTSACAQSQIKRGILSTPRQRSQTDRANSVGREGWRRATRTVAVDPEIDAELEKERFQLEAVVPGCVWAHNQLSVRCCYTVVQAAFLATVCLWVS
jgi:hypothetical protein